mgnify:CR=1 FL=1
MPNVDRYPDLVDALMKCLGKRSIAGDSFHGFTSTKTGRIWFIKDSLIDMLARLASVRMPEVHPKVRAMLDSKSPRTRAVGIAALIEINMLHSQNVPATGSDIVKIRELARDADELVRYHAGEFLWRILGEPEIKREFLLTTLAVDTIYASETLKHLRFLRQCGAGSEEAFEFIEDLVCDSEHNNVMVEAAKCLEQFGEQARPLLMKFAMDPNPMVSETAAKLPKRLGNAPTGDAP